MARDPQALTLRTIGREQAARAFAACAAFADLDPEGTETPEAAAHAGECFAARGEGGEVALSIDFGAGVAWVVAAVGGSDCMAVPTLAAIERLAVARGCERVGFQTVRPGLHRIATRRGYVAQPFGRGFKLEKKL